jgi:hypothetical protein
MTTIGRGFLLSALAMVSVHATVEYVDLLNGADHSVQVKLFYQGELRCKHKMEYEPQQLQQVSFVHHGHTLEKIKAKYVGGSLANKKSAEMVVTPQELTDLATGQFYIQVRELPDHALDIGIVPTSVPTIEEINVVDQEPEVSTEIIQDMPLAAPEQPAVAAEAEELSLPEVPAIDQDALDKQDTTVAPEELVLEEAPEVKEEPLAQQTSQGLTADELAQELRRLEDSIEQQKTALLIAEDRYKDLLQEQDKRMQQLPAAEAALSDEIIETAQ